MGTEAIFLLLIVAVVWFWYESAQVREQVVKAARNACERQGLQLLDETVLLKQLRFRRDRSGRVRLLREFRFEFGASDGARYQGRLLFFAGRVTELDLLPPGVGEAE